MMRGALKAFASLGIYRLTKPAYAGVDYQLVNVKRLQLLLPNGVLWVIMICLYLSPPWANFFERTGSVVCCTYTAVSACPMQLYIGNGTKITWNMVEETWTHLLSE